MTGRLSKFLAQVCLALVAALGVVASPAAAQTTVRVASAGIASAIGFFLALKKGYFRDEGLNVELAQMANAPQMIGPLGMGQLDVGAGTVAASLYNAVAQNIAIRAVADKGSMRKGYGFTGLLVRKDLIDSGRYKSYADLKGLKLAVGTFGSANASAMNEALKKGGLKWSDASVVALVFPQHIVAYQNKAIDASMTNEPTATTAVQNGLAVRVAGNDEIYPSQQTAVVLYSENFARQKPQIAHKFMRAYVRAVRDYNDALKDGHIAGPKAEEVIATLTEHTFIKDAAIHRSITPAAIDPDGRMNLDGLRNDLAFFKEQKLLQDPNITVERIIDTSFVEKAVQELGPYKPRN
jgi:NitT/TauT family transport system substrate-binding protein